MTCAMRFYPFFSMGAVWHAGCREKPPADRVPDGLSQQPAAVAVYGRESSGVIWPPW